MTKVIEGQLVAAGIHFGIVAGRFNSFVSEHLVTGAIDTIVRHGGKRSDITVVRVPGSFEIPLACKRLAESGKIDAIVAVGAVIRGSTSHYDYVCNEMAKGISSVQLATSIPIGFGVITTDTIEQAIERSGCKAGNKGAEAALAAIEMANLMKEIVREGV